MHYLSTLIDTLNNKFKFLLTYLYNGYNSYILEVPNIIFFDEICRVQKKSLEIGRLS